MEKETLAGTETLSPDNVTFKAGAGGVVITPTESVRMRGFGNPDSRMSQGAYQDLCVKVLVLDDGKNRAAIVGADFIGWPNYLTEEIRKRLKESCHLQPGQIFLNASHTHCGPEIGGEPTPYVKSILEKTVALVEKCFESAEEAKIYFGHSRSDIATNRRRLDRDGYAYWGLNRFGIADHDVPVLKVTRQDGSIIAVVVNYSCHTTTIGGNFLGGDYAGFVKEFVEQKVPGATVVFLQGCAGETKPGRRNKKNPTQFEYGGGPAAAREVGEKLGRAVLDVLAGELTEITGLIQGKLKAIDLPLITVVMDDSKEAGIFLGPKRRMARFAKAILNSVDEKGNYKKTWPAEIQVIRIGKDFVLVGISSEVCAGIGLNIKARLDPRPVIACGYTNRYFEPYNGYIPSRCLIAESGYEATIPFSPEMEDFMIDDIMKMSGKGTFPERYSSEGMLSPKKTDNADK